MPLLILCVAQSRSSKTISVQSYDPHIRGHEGNNTSQIKSLYHKSLREKVRDQKLELQTIMNTVTYSTLSRDSGQFTVLLERQALHVCLRVNERKIDNNNYDETKKDLA